MQQRVRQIPLFLREKIANKCSHLIGRCVSFFLSLAPKGFLPFNWYHYQVENQLGCGLSRCHPTNQPARSRQVHVQVGHSSSKWDSVVARRVRLRHILTFHFSKAAQRWSRGLFCVRGCSAAATTAAASRWRRLGSSWWFTSNLMNLRRRGAYRKSPWSRDLTAELIYGSNPVFESALFLSGFSTFLGGSPEWLFGWSLLRQISASIN